MESDKFLKGRRLLYVGGLSDSICDEHLLELFGTYGIVSRAHIVRHKGSGKSAGYGFVEMISGEEAFRAVAALEGTVFAGNCLRVYVTPYASRHL